MNKWVGSGKISADPIVRYNDDKVSFVAFTVMTKRNRKIREGDQAVDFIDCICTGNNARLAVDFLRKGKKVEVSGPIQSGHYVKDGVKVYTKTVYAEEIIFAETKAEEEARIRSEQAQEAPSGPAPDGAFMDIPDGVDEELPFR